MSVRLMADLVLASLRSVDVNSASLTTSAHAYCSSSMAQHLHRMQTGILAMFGHVTWSKCVIMGYARKRTQRIMKRIHRHGTGETKGRE